MMKIIYLILLVGLLCACNAASKKTQNEKEEAMESITFNNGVLTPFAALPDSMIDRVAWENTIGNIPNAGNKLLIFWLIPIWTVCLWGV